MAGWNRSSGRVIGGSESSVLSTFNGVGTEFPSERVLGTSGKTSETKLSDGKSDSWRSGVIRSSFGGSIGRSAGS